MTEQEFDARVLAIEHDYDGGREGSESQRDQQMANLLLEALADGKTQQWMGERLGGRTQGWVSGHLLFGRYLDYCGRNNSEAAPPGLTKWRFRAAWEKSGKQKGEPEAVRFSRVAELLANAAGGGVTMMPKNYANLVKKPGIKKAIVELLSQGRRLDVGEIQEGLADRFPGLERTQIGGALRDLQRKPPAGKDVVATHAGKSHKYKVVARKGPAPLKLDMDRLSVMAQEIAPLVEECIREMKAPEIRRQDTLVLAHLNQIKKFIDAVLPIRLAADTRRSESLTGTDGSPS